MQGFQHRRARLIATAALLLASGEDVRAGEAVTTIHVTYDEAYEEVRPSYGRVPTSRVSLSSPTQTGRSTSRFGEAIPRA